MVLGRHHLLLQVLRVGVRRQEGSEPELLLRLLLLRLERQDLVQGLGVAVHLCSQPIFHCEPRDLVQRECVAERVALFVEVSQADQDRREATRQNQSRQEKKP